MGDYNNKDYQETDREKGPDFSKVGCFWEEFEGRGEIFLLWSASGGIGLNLFNIS